MCVIALSPIGKSIDKSTLSDMWDTNPDGSGISFIDETKTIQTYKSMEKDDFLNVPCLCSTSTQYRHRYLYIVVLLLMVLFALQTITHLM